MTALTALTRPDEAIALRLMQAIREAAEAAAAPAAIELISVTFDMTGPAVEPSALNYATAIDRKTRTILFTGGAASGPAGVVMTATAIYRVQAGS